MKKMRSSLASSCARAMSLPCCLQSVADEDCYSDCYSDCLPVITQFIVSLLHLSLASTRIDVSSLLSVYAISDLPLICTSHFTFSVIHWQHTHARWHRHVKHQMSSFASRMPRSTGTTRSARCSAS